MTNAINSVDPWSGLPVRQEGLSSYRGQVVGFAARSSREQFEEATSLFDAAITAGPTMLDMAGVPALSIDFASAALVIVDAQEEYRSGRLPLDGMAAAVGQAQRLLTAARSMGVPVFHIVHRGRAGGLFDPAGKGGAILPELAPCAGEAVIEKTLPNAFTDTTLADHLRSHEPTVLLIGGFMTHNCVEATARGALDLGFAAAVIADATATRALPDALGGPPLSAAEVQRATLAGLADRSAHVTRLEVLISGASSQ